MSQSNNSSHRQSLGQTQALRQQQSLSPQQVLFVRLLGLNAIELEDEVRRTLDENPALEAIDESEAAPKEDLAGVLPPSEADDEGSAFDESPEALQISDFNRIEDIPFVVAGNVDDFLSPSGRIDPAAIAISKAEASSGQSIIDHLNEQIAELDLTATQKSIAAHIVGNIDDNGYLTVPLRQITDELALLDGIEVTTAEVTEVFNAIRSLEPAGICAVDLRDCLLLQMRRRRQTDNSRPVAIACEMLSDYFDLFSKRHFDRLCSALGVTHDQLKQAVEAVQSLNPKPGAIISGGRTDDVINQITPDFVVDTDGHNVDLQITNSIPELRIESSFDIDDTQLPTKPRQSDALTFIRNRRDDAATYIHAINLRRMTLYRVMRAIISLQRDFFLSEGDVTTLHPMILKDVASITGDDISVVSRATAGKYVATRFGTYPLKFFFNEAVNPKSTDSSHKIIETLRSIIATEDPTDPLSDEALAVMLHDKGYDIARRTVAKYREKASIPVARLRRRLG